MSRLSEIEARARSALTAHLNHGGECWYCAHVKAKGPVATEGEHNPAFCDCPFCELAAEQPPQAPARGDAPDLSMPSRVELVESLRQVRQERDELILQLEAAEPITSGLGPNQQERRSRSEAALAVLEQIGETRLADLPMLFSDDLFVAQFNEALDNLRRTQPPARPTEPSAVALRVAVVRLVRSIIPFFAQWKTKDAAREARQWMDIRAAMRAAHAVLVGREVPDMNGAEWAAEYDMEWHMRHQRGPTEPSPAVIEQWFTEFYRLVDEHCPVGAQARLRTWASVFRGILQPRTEA